MNAKQLAAKAIEVGEQAKWASTEVKIQLAFGRCAEHIYWCDDARLMDKAAVTMANALDYVMMHFSPVTNELS
jgi:hypothetical protein